MPTAHAQPPCNTARRPLVTQLGGFPALSSQAGLPSRLWVVGRQEAVVHVPLRKPRQVSEGAGSARPQRWHEAPPHHSFRQGCPPVPPQAERTTLALGRAWPRKGPWGELGINLGCGTHPDPLTCRLSLHTREVSLHYKVTSICGVCPPARRSAPHLMNPQPSPAE